MSKTLDFKKRALASLWKKVNRRGNVASVTRRNLAKMGVTTEEELHEITRQADPGDDFLEETAKEIFSSPLSAVPASHLVDLAEGTAALCLANGLKMSQIRNFFGHVKHLFLQYKGKEGEFSPDDVELLRIPLAYSRGRNKAIEPFYLTCSAAMEKVSSKEDFERFVQFIEAVVAYHKYYGGE